jgi:hypothetical protein
MRTSKTSLLLLSKTATSLVFESLCDATDIRRIGDEGSTQDSH